MWDFLIFTARCSGVYYNEIFGLPSTLVGAWNSNSARCLTEDEIAIYINDGEKLMHVGVSILKFIRKSLLVGVNQLMYPTIESTFETMLAGRSLE